jgi:hypothetical protein
MDPQVKYLIIKSSYRFDIGSKQDKVDRKSRFQKLLVFLKTYLKPTFTIWNMKIMHII